MLYSMARGKMTPAEIRELSCQVEQKASDLPTLMNPLEGLEKRFG